MGSMLMPGMGTAVGAVAGGIWSLPRFADTDIAPTPNAATEPITASAARKEAIREFAVGCVNDASRRRSVIVPVDCSNGDEDAAHEADFAVQV